MGETGGTIPGVRREAEKEVAAMEAIGQWGKDAATHYSSRGYKHSPRSITLPDAAERYPFDTSNGGIGHAVRDRDTILPPMGAVPSTSKHSTDSDIDLDSSAFRRTVRGHQASDAASDRRGDKDVGPSGFAWNKLRTYGTPCSAEFTDSV